jgi:hypothetical protein
VQVGGGKLDAGSIARVPAALLPEIGEDPVVILDGNGLGLKIGRELTGHGSREAPGKSLVGLVGEPVLVTERIRIGHTHADVVVGLENPLGRPITRRRGRGARQCRCWTVVIPDSSISKAE